MQEIYSLKEFCKKCVSWKNVARNVLTCKNFTRIALCFKILARNMFFERILQDSYKNCIFVQIGNGEKFEMHQSLMYMKSKIAYVEALKTGNEKQLFVHVCLTINRLYFFTTFIFEK